MGRLIECDVPGGWACSHNVQTGACIRYCPLATECKYLTQDEIGQVVVTCQPVLRGMEGLSDAFDKGGRGEGEAED